MSVSEYAEKFTHLGRFHTLRGDLKLMVAPLSITEFPALVEKARVMEKLKAEVEAQQRPQQKVGGPFGSTSIQNDRRKPSSGVQEILTPVSSASVSQAIVSSLWRAPHEEFLPSAWGQIDMSQVRPGGPLLQRLPQW